MRKRLTLFLLGLFLFPLATPGFSANLPGAVTLSPFVGGYTFDSDQELETSPVFGLRGGYNFTSHLAAEALFSYVLTESNVTNRETDVYRYGVDLLYHFTPERQLVPFIAAGYGGISFNTPSQTEYTTGVFNFGVGVKYFIADRVALRADFRDLVVTSGSQNNLEYTAGLTFLFGGTKKSAEPTPIAQAAPVAAAPVLVIVPAAARTQEYCSILDIPFEINQDTIQREEKEKIGVVATFMKKYPDTTALIEGHTDNVGTSEENMRLSQRRAESVVSYLVDSSGIAPSRLKTEAYGETRPIADNSTEEGKRLNRRINAVIACATDIEGLTPVPARVTMALEMEFDTNRADVRPEYREELRKVANFMKANPSVTATVEGHTSNYKGTPADALQLSSLRAENVVNYLVKEFGIDRSRLFAQGFGQTRRFAYNTSAEGQQENRRINIIINYAK